MVNAFQKITPMIKRDDKQVHTVLIKILQNAKTSIVWKNLQEFESDFISVKPLELALIRACKYVVSNYLKANQHQEINGLSIKEIIETEKPFHQYLKDVEKMDEYAYGIHVQLGFLPLLLNFSQTIVTSDKVYESPKNNSVGTVYLYYHDSHYDLLYK